MVSDAFVYKRLFYIINVGLWYVNIHVQSICIFCFKLAEKEVFFTWDGPNHGKQIKTKINKTVILF